jgi:glycosyltransferase involved in cell wall biosynthesis
MNKHVVVAIPVLFVGGTEIQTLSLIRVLTSKGYLVSACCYYEYDEGMVREVQEAGARIILLKLDRKDGLLCLTENLVRVFRELNPDMAHIQYIAPGFIPVLAARIAGIKTIFATVHQPGHPYGWYAKLLLRLAARICTVFFCTSRAVEESWFGDSQLFDPHTYNGRRRHCTIYNSIDVDRITEIVNSVDRKELKQSVGAGDNLMVGIVGRLRKEKGHSILLEAMVQVIKAIPNAVLLAVGDGPDRQKLEEQASALGIARHVLWVGQKKCEEVFRLYAIMDVAAVPSLFEGFGLSAAEAMASGIPVVGTRVGGLTEVIEDGVTGILVREGKSNEDLSAALIDILSNPEKARAMGRRGHERVRERFSPERFRESMISLYRRYS